MVKLQSPPHAQNSAPLLLPAEVRTKIWRLLFADSKVVYNKCIYDKELSSKRYQVVQTCRYAYLDAFALLWSHTNIAFIDCVPAPESAGLREQFAASAPCRKLIPRLEFELRDTQHMSCLTDFRGLCYFAMLKKVSIGPIGFNETNIPPIDAVGLDYSKLAGVRADELLLQALAEWLSSSTGYGPRHVTSAMWLGSISDLLLRRNRKYHIFLNFVIYFHDYGQPDIGLYKRLDVTIDWDNADGKKIIRNSCSLHTLPGT